MKFVNPSFLYALSAVAIPILIHLFNFRRYKTVYFTNVRFLKEVQLETKSRSRLKHLLVLLSRILAISMLVLAFAQPCIPVDHKKIASGEQLVSIYLDNSFSMDAVSKSGRLLDEGKKTAAEVAAAYKPGDRFQLLTNDFEGRHQRLLSRDEFLQLLEEVKLSPDFKNLQQVFTRQADLLNSNGSRNKTAFVISDFQSALLNKGLIKNDTNISVNLVPLNAEDRSNLSMDSCWFVSPVRKQNQVEQLHIRIKNFSNKTYDNIPVKLVINNQERTPASFNLKANAQLDTVLSFTIREGGIQSGWVELSDYPVTFDDRLYFSYTVLKQIPILAINPAAKDKPQASVNPYLKSLFAKDSVVVFSNTEENKIDYSTLSGFRMIILNELKTVSSGLAQELNKFVQGGGNLIVFPSDEADINSYKEFLGGLNCNYYEGVDTSRTQVGSVNYTADIYREVFEKKTGNIDLPVVFRHFMLSHNSRSSEETLLKLRDGNSFLDRTVHGKGQIYLSAVPLNTGWSNFVKHALFVPTLYQAVLFSQPQYRLFYTIGNPEEIDVTANPAGDEIFKICSSDKKIEIIPEYKVLDSRTTLFIHDQIRDPGNYFLNLDKETLRGISFNYNRNESDLSVYTADGLKKLIESKSLANFHVLDFKNQTIRAALSEIAEGKKLWKLCIILALVFLACEIALLRLLK